MTRILIYSVSRVKVAPAVIERIVVSKLPLVVYVFKWLTFTFLIELFVPVHVYALKDLHAMVLHSYIWSMLEVTLDFIVRVLTVGRLHKWVTTIERVRH